jgi:hypothetical protein
MSGGMVGDMPTRKTPRVAGTSGDAAALSEDGKGLLDDGVRHPNVNIARRKQRQTNGEILNGRVGVIKIAPVESRLVRLRMIIHEIEPKVKRCRKDSGLKRDRRSKEMHYSAFMAVI